MTMMHETQYVGNIKDEQEHIACVRREGVHQLLFSARISGGVSPQSQLISLYIGNGLPIEQMCSPTQLIRLLGQRDVCTHRWLGDGAVLGVLRIPCCGA